MHIQDILPKAEFVCNAERRAVWQVASMAQARKAIRELGAKPYNWCDVQQPNGPPAAKPKISIAF